VLTAKAYLADQDGTEVMVADAPFVEGAVAAAVTASGGATLAEVVAVRRGRAMSASSDHEVAVEEVAVLAADLHARPAGQVTRAATGVDAGCGSRGRPGRGSTRAACWP
jgi:PTS hybrid protein